jgi:hypothetical protein
MIDTGRNVLLPTMLRLNVREALAGELSESRTEAVTV